MEQEDIVYFFLTYSTGKCLCVFAGPALHFGHPSWVRGAPASQPDLPHCPPHQVQECQADQRGG
jgi:hypothetical protein